MFVDTMKTPGVEEAKARLLEVGRESPVTSWVGEKPAQAILVAIFAGAVAARLSGKSLPVFLDLLARLFLAGDEKP